MGKKKSSSRRKRRSPEEIIADLQEEIRRVRDRQVARELKKSPSHKLSMAAIRSIDRALESAGQEGNTSLRHALADARKPLAAYLEKQGVRLPRARLPRGRRPKDDAAD